MGKGLEEAGLQRHTQGQKAQSYSKKRLTVTGQLWPKTEIKARVGEDVKKLDPCMLVVSTQHGAVLWKQDGSFSEKHTELAWASISTPGYTR